MPQEDWSSAQWRTSTRSSATGACVEVAFSKEWRKSSWSSGNGECVEVACGHDRTAARDSKNPGGPILEFDRADWAAFLRRV